VNATAGIALERLALRFGTVEVAMMCVSDLAPHVDVHRLLGVGEVAEPPYWMHLWPGARVLAQSIARTDRLADKTVLELGCGMGLPALVAAARGAQVVATDRERAPLALVAESAALNGVEVGLVQMDWRNPCLARSYDLVLGADVAYDSGEEESLVEAFVDLVAPRGKLLLADSVNTYRRELMPKLVAAGFALREGSASESDEGRAVRVRWLEGVRQ
jgi:predicted nicotinamide N-methyase